MLDTFYETMLTQSFNGESGLMFMLRGLCTTVEITFFAVLLGIVLGSITAAARIPAGWGSQIGDLIHPGEHSGRQIATAYLRYIARKLSELYIVIIRGTPVIVQLAIIYFVIFASVNIDRVLVAVIAFGLNSGAYISEIIRAGILSVDHGQTEASRSLGLSASKTMRYVVFPQAISNILPALGNEFIVLLKETAVVSLISLNDLMFAATRIRAQKYDAFTPLITAACMYLILTYVLSLALRYAEQRMKAHDRS